jgi:hypothetical protein
MIEKYKHESSKKTDAKRIIIYSKLDENLRLYKVFNRGLQCQNEYHVHFSVLVLK